MTTPPTGSYNRYRYARNVATTLHQPPNNITQTDIAYFGAWQRLAQMLSTLEAAWNLVAYGDCG